jgi:hypothetical protein
MATFRVVHVSQTKDLKPGEFSDGWAVERADPDEKPYIVSRLYPTQQAAQECADKRTAQEIDKATD